MGWHLAEGEYCDIDITDTSVATDIYVILTCDDIDLDLETTVAAQLTQDQRNKVAFQGLPLPASTIAFTASGQNIIEEMPAQYFGEFSRRTMGDGFWETAGGCGMDRQKGLPPLLRPANWISTEAGQYKCVCH